MSARAWESLAGFTGQAERCTCSDHQLDQVGCDCAAQQNLPIGCDCGQWLRSQSEIAAGGCKGCQAEMSDPRDAELAAEQAAYDRFHAEIDLPLEPQELTHEWVAEMDKHQ